jgi:cytochrome c oxidase cbb3-type subunit IV
MNIQELQAYVYFAVTLFLVFLLYLYVYHLYTSKRKGGEDYEKYSNLALDDGINDKIVDQVGSARTNS